MSLYSIDRADIERFAVESFANHRIEQWCGPNDSNPKTPHVFRCSSPGTNSYSFTVVLSPGTICVWGDLGEWILRHSDHDSYSWLTGAVNSPQYMISKIRAGEGNVFNPDEAIRMLNSWKEDEKSCPYPDWVMREVCNYLEDMDGMSEDIWHLAWREAGADEVNPCLFPSCGALWLIQAMKCFIRLYPLHVPIKHKEKPCLK